MRAGQGGEDARLIALDLLTMYRSYAKDQGIECELISLRDSDPGIRSAVLLLNGKRAHKLLGESGVHSIQHLTRSRKKERIHTSTVSVASVLESDLAVNAENLNVTRDNIRIDTFRGSGAGGQHRNKTDSAVRAVHVPTGEMVTITSGRSQHKNREEALLLLTMKLFEKTVNQIESKRSEHRRGLRHADRAMALRTYDLIRNNVRCSDGKKINGAQKVLNGNLGLILE